MANQFLNVQWISDEVLRLLLNFLTVAEYFNSHYDKDFEKYFAVGSTIQVKFPQLFTIRDGLGYDPQGINRISTTVSVNQPFGIDFEWDDYEAAVKAERSEEEIREQYLQPASTQIAQEIDSRCANFAWINANNVVGTLGTDPTGLTTYAAARRRLKELACPPGKKAACISSSMMENFSTNINTYFQPPDEISAAFKEGAIGNAQGFDWYESNSLYSTTAGTWASSVTVTGANQSGSQLIITGTNGDTLVAGDKFSIANVNQVNPRTRRIVGPKTAKPFTVTQSYTLDGNADTITILPAIYGPGSQYQNVDAFPANGAALTLWPGTTNPNGATGTLGLALSKYAFALVGIKFYLPKAVESRSQSQDPQTGIPLRFVKFWDPVRSIQGNRFDTCMGNGNLYQDNGAVVIAGA